MRKLILILFLATSCEIKMDNDFPLSVSNNSETSINVYFNTDQNFQYIYPDSTITNFENRISEKILPSQIIAVSGGSSHWESIFEINVPNDTLSMFIINSDTLNLYNLGEIGSTYNILKRYDLSLSNLKDLDFIVSYPPTLEMENIRQYPEFE
ncbi:hypothetical protein [Winogradskyella sp.]|uniref:hypothetical protein n=1 Tax=Winogradskyella sp. TaxID=1883156 RepID=UPI0026270437|nr:hypothetical protein [Winogradskyella sp.]